MFLVYVICLGLVFVDGGYTQDTDTFEGEKLLLKHILKRRDAPFPGEYPPLPNTQTSEDSPESPDSNEPTGTGTFYYSPETVHSQSDNNQHDLDRRRERIEAERRRRDHQAELDRRNRQIAERRSQSRIESRRQSSSSSGSTSTGQHFTYGQNYPSSGQGHDQGQRTQTSHLNRRGSNSNSGSRSSTSQQYPIYGYNGQQGVYAGSQQPYYVTGRGSVPRGTYVPGGTYVPSGGSYVSSRGTYVPSGGSYVPSGGSYVPSGGSYVPSGGYVPAGGTYVPGGSGGSYIPQSSVPRYTPNTQYDSICPSTGVRLRINGLDCSQAINQFGSSLCYRHEFTSRECCDRCQPLKNPAKSGCEYGDHSYQCRQLQRFDCYDLRQSQRCCESCQRFRTGEPGCEYGDMTPRCQQIRENPSLCYVPDNARFCCSTCATIKDISKPECPWGDHNSNLCRPYHTGGEVRINCYSPPIERLCCQTCERIKSRYSGQYSAPGCEYGDRPVVFNTGRYGSMNCTSFIRQFSIEQCQSNPAVAENCCFTCRRYQQG